MPSSSPPACLHLSLSLSLCMHVRHHFTCTSLLFAFSFFHLWLFLLPFSLPFTFACTATIPLPCFFSPTNSFATLLCCNKPPYFFPPLPPPLLALSYLLPQLEEAYADGRGRAVGAMPGVTGDAGSAACIPETLPPPLWIGHAGSLCRRAATGCQTTCLRLPFLPPKTVMEMPPASPPTFPPSIITSILCM